MKKCSKILGLLGYAAYGVNLCNNIFIAQGKPKNGPARHPRDRSSKFVEKLPSPNIKTYAPFTEVPSAGFASTPAILR